ncbi:4Fe-4S binding protein [Campylobacter geochelonis]|uniref:4Fe-4S ferredoxin iron-sulfur binding domain-containing protein n=1 Tax=Campylobacter geochelonis TaxID=1780362 RepID=A0A128EDZ5_9BACT|nr:4Fe-4S binding protein [Campylobacter geochelonis]QKF72147.1 hydrogenase-4, iron-sulfur protein (SEC10/PgrA surface exclusion domain) [Campylobacter geochelonis]CZE45990.1 4Fe-4S ferredoxin iron-sulfur binding domain-containing protein [Campylobacter geochelonis]CZE46632.1 4Fe-4S ferredoxin iron-sulfur binding domain-containing protein [Campylobacter geochelonis]
MSKLNKFVICNPDLCIACNACMKTCIKNAYVRGRLSKARLDVLKRESGKMPNQCRQCDDAPCANVCPTSALRLTNSCVELHEELCIGCKLCTIVCPYGCIYIEGEIQPSAKDEAERHMEIGCVSGIKSLAVKCDMCSGRDDGPACVDICPKGALLLVEPISLEHKFGKKLKADMTPFLQMILNKDEVMPKKVEEIEEPTSNQEAQTKENLEKTKDSKENLDKVAQKDSSNLENKPNLDKKTAEPNLANLKAKTESNLDDKSSEKKLVKEAKVSDKETSKEPNLNENLADKSLNLDTKVASSEHAKTPTQSEI